MAKQFDGDIFPAEELLEKRIRKDGALEYLVKWKGWTKRHSTWEPIYNIFDQRLIQDFKRKEQQSSTQLYITEVTDQVLPDLLDTESGLKSIKSPIKSENVEDELYPSPKSTRVSGETLELAVVDVYEHQSDEDTHMETSISSLEMSSDHLEDELFPSPASPKYAPFESSEIEEVERQESGSIVSICDINGADKLSNSIHIESRTEENTDVGSKWDSVSGETEPSKSLSDKDMFIEVNDIESSQVSGMKSDTFEDVFELPVVVPKEVIGQRNFWHQQSISDIFKLMKNGTITVLQMTQAILSPKVQVLSRYNDYCKNQATLENLKQMDTYSDTPRLKTACDFKERLHIKELS